MDHQQETLDIIHGIWEKLNALPEAEALEIGAFVVLLLFVFVFIFLVAMSCTTCCSSKTTRKSTKVEPA
ncbi:unnamed protein product [Knipowitschia caucasica]